MTKNAMMALVNFLNTHDIPELADVREELNAQYAKDAEKAAANREIYEMAHDVIMGVIDDTPRTIAEIFETCKTELPEGFTKSKLQYAIRAMWTSEIVKVEQAKGANKYVKA